MRQVSKRWTAGLPALLRLLQTVRARFELPADELLRNATYEHEHDWLGAEADVRPARLAPEPV